jgi:hypothetical protein
MENQDIENNNQRATKVRKSRRMENQDIENFKDVDISPEVASAYREAEARGLPTGWICTIDVRVENYT